MGWLRRLLRYEVRFSVGLVLVIAIAATVLVLAWPDAPLWAGVLLGAVIGMSEDAWHWVTRRKSGA